MAKQQNINPALMAALGAANAAANPSGPATPAPAAANQMINEQVRNLAQQLANEMVAQRDALEQAAQSGRTYTKFAGSDVIRNQTETVTGGIWSDNLASLVTYFTASTQTTSQRRYYVDILQETPTADGAAVQYSIAYGNALGSGSDSTGQLNDSPSRAVYSQYKQLLLNPTDTRFTTAGSGSTDSIYVVNFKRNRLKERLDVGNFELPLLNVTNRTVNATGSITVGNTVVTLIDDSSIRSATTGQSGKVYNVVSGSIAGGVYNASTPTYFGLVYPDYGTMILDGKMLDQHLGFKTNLSSSVEGNNHFTLFHCYK